MSRSINIYLNSALDPIPWQLWPWNAVRAVTCAAVLSACLRLMKHAADSSPGGVVEQASFIELTISRLVVDRSHHDHPSFLSLGRKPCAAVCIESSSLSTRSCKGWQRLRQPQQAQQCSYCAGVALFHRSGDARAGLHGNTALWTPTADSHRVALVLYQTDVKIRED